MNKIKYTFFLLLFININAFAQLVIEGTPQLILEKGIYLNIEGNIENNGTFVSDSLSYVKLAGNIQEIKGQNTLRFAHLIIDGTGNKILANLQTEKAEIFKSLLFNANKIVLNNNNLELLHNVQLLNANNQKYVVTNSTGSLIRHNTLAGNSYLFPVGNNNSYNPVIISPLNITDTLAVRIADGVNPSDDAAVQKTYIIRSAHPNVALSDVSLAWDIADEGINFDATQALMWQKENGTYNLLTGNAGAIGNMPQTDWQYATQVTFKSAIADSLIVKSAAPPLITEQPRDTAICAFENALFSVSVSSLTTPSFQWQINCSGTWTNLTNGGVLPHFSGCNDSILILTEVPYNLNGCSFRCIVSNSGGSDTSHAAVLTVHPQPTATIVGDYDVCIGDVAELSLITNASSYVWSTGETTEHIIVVPLPPAQTYSVTVTDFNSCTNTAEINIQVEDDFSVVLTSNYEPENLIIKGQNIHFTATPPYYDEYIFMIGNDTVQISNNNIYYNNNLTENTWVSVTAFSNNCSATDSVFVIVKEIPNAFTPYNINGKNDLFAKDIYLIIQNRWGQILFEGTEGWDGMYNNKKVSPGTYFYYLTFNKNTKQEFTVRGSVLLISK